MKSKKIKIKHRKMKMKIKKKIILKPWGGFLPFPPKNCKMKQYIFKDNSIKWLDLVICINCPDYIENKKGCERRIEYLNKLKNKEK